MHYDTTTSPLALLHPNMEFRGYVEISDGSISAKKAYALAEKWLAKEMKEYERTVLA